jgi:hypothetical protein
MSRILAAMFALTIFSAPMLARADDAAPKTEKKEKKAKKEKKEKKEKTEKKEEAK